MSISEKIRQAKRKTFSVKVNDIEFVFNEAGGKTLKFFFEKMPEKETTGTTMSLMIDLASFALRNDLIEPNLEEEDILFIENEWSSEDLTKIANEISEHMSLEESSEKN